MSGLNSKLNFVVLLIVCGVVGYIVRRPVQPLPPPADSGLYEAINGSQPVLIKFGADWCPPCRALEPELDRLARDSQVRVIRINVDHSPDLARHYHISSIPRLLLFRNGQLLADRVGFASSEELKRWAKSQSGS